MEDVIHSLNHNISKEDLNVMVEQCKTEVKELKNREKMMVMELNSLKRKLRRTRNEKDYLLRLQRGEDPVSALQNMRPDVMGTLTLRYNTLYRTQHSSHTTTPNPSAALRARSRERGSVDTPNRSKSEGRNRRNRGN